jgi:hypothetical protein
MQFCSDRSLIRSLSISVRPEKAIPADHNSLKSHAAISPIGYAFDSVTNLFVNSPEADCVLLCRPHPIASVDSAFGLRALSRRFITRRLPSNRPGLVLPHSVSDCRHFLIQCPIGAIPIG